MEKKRFFYSASIEEFIGSSSQDIHNEIIKACPHVTDSLTSKSWKEEIRVMQTSLFEYKYRGSIFFEYDIPRMGLRPDVIVIIDGIVFVLEFKTGSQKFSNEFHDQVWDYALSLKYFHQGSHNRVIVPILVCPAESAENCELDLKPFGDNVYEPLHSNGACLKECFKIVLTREDSKAAMEGDMEWAMSSYEPTPTIIEATIALYKNHTVKDITRHDARLENCINTVSSIISDCRKNKSKAICFITGVPGAGKTLVGLEIAIKHLGEEKAIYLSGNGPLVKVLCKALAIDYVRRSKEEYVSGKRKDKPSTLKEAEKMAESLIQIIHHYRDSCLSGNTPNEHVVIFDEAQRAWTKDKLAKFMREKKGIFDFQESEPEYLISCSDRHKDWAVIVCLIGGGQEIYTGEAGLKEWIDALNNKYKHWEVYISDRLQDKEYAGGDAIELIDQKERLHIQPSLHLNVSMRSFRAEKVSTFVHHLLELKKEEASSSLGKLEKYPIMLTRSLDKAKEWLRSKTRGSERYGLLSTSQADRSTGYSRFSVDFVSWFLKDSSDKRSSNALNNSLTEFQVQGLEIDWSCVTWDADLRLNNDHTAWEYFKIAWVGNNWVSIKKPIDQEYLVNAYRVLLTRARQGMIIYVPHGDLSGSDETRKPQFYEGIYNYLLSIGIKEI